MLTDPALFAAGGDGGRPAWPAGTCTMPLPLAPNGGTASNNGHAALRKLTLIGPRSNNFELWDLQCCVVMPSDRLHQAGAHDAQRPGGIADHTIPSPAQSNIKLQVLTPNPDSERQPCPLQAKSTSQV